MAAILTAAKAVTTPSAASIIKMNAATGPIQDISSNATLLVLKLQEAFVLATSMKAASDAGDANVTQLNTILADLV